MFNPQAPDSIKPLYLMQLAGNNLSNHLFEAVVIGAGPAGLATMACLMDNSPAMSEKPPAALPFLWIDPEFNSGRLYKYPLVPSNTRVNLFVKYAKLSPCLSKLFDAIPSAKALTEELNPDEGCQLIYAANMVKELTGSLLKQFGQNLIHQVKDHVTELSRPVAADSWKITTESGSTFNARKVYLATGSYPRPPNATLMAPFKGFIDLEDALNPDVLKNIIRDKKSLAVFGSSHSAMLVLYNICSLLDQEVKLLSLFNFYKSPLIFAKYLKTDVSVPTILHDNTGLKGKVADWVRTWSNDEDESPASCRRDVALCSGLTLHRIRCTAQTDVAAYGIDNAVFAIGYDPNPIPRILYQDAVISSAKHLDYSAEGELFIKQDSTRLRCLYGVGIAFPERIIDADGSREEAVGMYKFMRYISKIVKLHQ